jgi:Fic family protein
MMMGHDPAKNPSQWRPGPTYLVHRANGKTVYEGPDAALVNGLVQELVDYLGSPPREPIIVRAAMAHLNLAMIRPFKNGNGRVARAVQTLVLAQQGGLYPAFSSIEEWFGEAEPAYHGVLAEVGQGTWQPGRDAGPWIRFCLKAHCQQAAALIRRHAEFEALYDRIERIAIDGQLPDRAVIPLFDAAFGLATTNSWYRLDADVSEVVASRDLKRLCEMDLLVPHGEKRGRTYQGSKRLLAIRKAVRKELGTDMPFVDPYEIMPDMDLRSLYMEPPRDLSLDPRFAGF